MKYFLKTQWMWIAPFILLTLATITLILIKTKYEVITPAVITNVEGYIHIDTEEDVDVDINSVSLFGFSNSSLFNYLFSKVNPFSNSEYLDSYYNTNSDYIIEQGKIHRQLSIDGAISSGYSAAGYDVNLYFHGYKVTSVLANAKTDALLGDIITSVEGIQLTEEVSFIDVVKKLYQEKKQTSFNYNYIRNGSKASGLFTLYEIYNKNTNKSSLTPGIVTEAYFTIKSIDEEAPKYKAEHGGSIGPSGGLMQALYVYEALTGGNLTKDLKIAGTGTVDFFGNAGLISGIEQKIYIANANNVDVFFVPVDMSYEDEVDQKSNYVDALKAQELLRKIGQDDMEIVPVSSLEEIIKYLEERQK